MAHIEAPTTPSLRALQSQQDSVRRARPPDVDTMRHDENRVPLREDRMAKRESRINLRGLFGKAKPNKTVRGSESTSSLRELSRSGKRISLAEISNWPHTTQPPRSDTSTSNAPSNSSASSPTSAGLLKQSRKSAASAEPDLSPVARGTIAIPLFKAYPQAIKHGTLPCCTTPVENLLRLHTTKSGSISSKSELSQSKTALDSVEEATGEKKTEGGKKKGKNALEWKSKIYVLVTSGYLLQYAAEGTFNRLPEKALQLTRESAVFASDLLPGKHWVLQVASSMDANGNSMADPRSRISKLAFRNNAKRQVANFLLIFESAENMDSWLATLRKEIQSLGGRRKLSETGNLDVEAESPESRRRANRRTLVTRDPERFSRVMSSDFSLPQESSPSEATDPDTTGRLSEHGPDPTQDDVSRRTSMISSDGQRLDSLRNSNHRLSYMSSGQRTIFTSSDSSPACSPTRASFSSNRDDPSFHDHQQSLPAVPEVRPRPNAAAIMNRRQSMQTAIPGLEGGYEPVLRPQSSLSTITDTSAQDAGQHTTPNTSPVVPNFSVPQRSSRRFSATSSPPRDKQPDKELSPKPLRRSPPPVLGISRPLSVVLDDSPVSPHASSAQAKFPSPTRERFPSPLINSTSSLPRPQNPSVSSARPHGPSRLRRTGVLSPQPDNNTSPRKYSSTGDLRDNRKQLLLSQIEKSSFALSKATAQSPRSPAEAEVPHTRSRDIPRASSSMDNYGPAQHPMSPTSLKYRNKRASFGAERPSFQYSLNSFVASTPVYETPLVEEPEPGRSHIVSPERRLSPMSRGARLLSPKHRFSIDTQNKSVLARKSMPHLEGPPPLPPPNRALPALPKKNKPESPTEAANRAVRV